MSHPAIASAAEPARATAASPARGTWILFALALTLMPVDGFPAGMAVLREFGSRPVNMLLAVISLPVFLRMLATWAIPIPPIPRWALVIGGLLGMLFTGNVLVALVHSASIAASPFRPPMVSWAVQYAMAAWMLLSLVLWPIAFRRLDVLGSGYAVFVGLLAATAAVELLFYLEALATIVWGRPVVPLSEAVAHLFRAPDQTMRPHGLSTEPSLWGGWVAFCWPLLYFGSRALRSAAARISVRALALTLVASGLFAQARTLMVLLVAQLCVLAGSYVAVRRHRVRRLALVAGALLGCAIVFSAPLQSVWSVDESLSSTHRIGSTVAAAKVFLDHPIAGVGLGQLTYHYAAYLPAFALISEETAETAAQTTGYRASAYNVFARVGAEVGVVALALLVALYGALARRLRALRKVDADRAHAILLSVVGGAGYWLSQDSFGYQPALFSTALGLYAVWTRASAPATPAHAPPHSGH